MWSKRKFFLTITGVLWGLWTLALQTPQHLPSLEIWLKTGPGYLAYLVGFVGSLVAASLIVLCIFIFQSAFSFYSAHPRRLTELSDENKSLKIENQQLKTSVDVIRNRMSFISGHDNLISELRKIVNEADDFLYITGSRTSNASYISEIESKVKATPKLVHYRILHGYPWKKELKEHLLALRRVRPSNDRVRGQASCVLGIYIPYAETFSKKNPIKKSAKSRRREAEFFISVNEHRTLLIVPSLLNPGAFDTGLISTDADNIKAWKHYVEWLAGESEKLDSEEVLMKLPILDSMP